MKGIHRFIDFYNSERPHSTIQYKTPEQKEKEYWDKKKESSFVWEFRVQNRAVSIFTQQFFCFCFLVSHSGERGETLENGLNTGFMI